MPIILRLDRVMADRKMSLNELSERVGVANVNLSKLKNGRVSAIRFSTLEAICEVLDCQPEILQRKLEVGYSRAAKLIDRMEELGFISAQDGNKPRRVLVTKADLDELRMNGKAD